MHVSRRKFDYFMDTKWKNLGLMSSHPRLPRLDLLVNTNDREEIVPRFT